MKKDKPKLTPRQERFVAEYLLDLNGTQAAVRAGYSPRTANEQAGRLLVNASVRAAIKRAMDERAKRLNITVDWVIEKLREEAERPVKSSQQSSRVRALELIGKHLGMFAERFQVPEEVRVRVIEDENWYGNDAHARAAVGAAAAVVSAAVNGRARGASA